MLPRHLVFNSFPKLEFEEMVVGREDDNVVVLVEMVGREDGQQ